MGVSQKRIPYGKEVILHMAYDKNQLQYMQITKHNLKQVIEDSDDFQALTRTDQMRTQGLANTFIQSRMYIYLDPEDLAEQANVGTPDQWETFLNLSAVRTYCTQHMLQNKDTQQRRLLQTLMKSASTGNVQAAKSALDLLSSFEQKHKPTIIIHSVPRPSTHKKPNKPPEPKEVEAVDVPIP